MSYLDTIYTTDNDYQIPDVFDVRFSDPARTYESAALEHMSVNEVLAWIAFARHGGFNHRPCNWRLTDDQVIAISALAETDDGLGGESTGDFRANAERAAVNISRASAFGEPMPEESPTTLLSDRGQAIHAGLPHSMVDPLSSDGKMYWCTACGKDKPRSYKNCDGWKREEKQHEVTYVCMLGGARESSMGSSKCVFCGAIDPENSHFDTHNVRACTTADAGSFSCKRRCDMVQHRNPRHSIDDKPHSEAIATSWKSTLDKSAWSCGFCVKIFTAFNDRLKHLQFHFEQGKTLADWNATTVVQGLLQQPALDEAWKAKMLSTQSSGFRDIEWKDDAMQSLQPMLERGPCLEMNAEALADAAYEASEVTWWSNDD
ncbi:hypothetical protein N7G274_004335 [Stereocaulon virgatum]|uniref:C2H2-type domain-containing protein n=1 Tax=Stereocaulon virgatum TaxID=373712 RepID=A0ABR4ACK9_9LECA